VNIDEIIQSELIKKLIKIVASIEGSREVYDPIEKELKKNLYLYSLVYGHC